MIAQEHDQQRRCRGEVVAPDGGARQVREGKIGRGRAEGDHQRRDSHVGKRTNPPGPRAQRDRRAVRERQPHERLPRVCRVCRRLHGLAERILRLDMDPQRAVVEELGEALDVPPGGVFPFC